ncbi:MAG: FecCD family ABC transporter permease [Terriglobales bacterium]
MVFALAALGLVIVLAASLLLGSVSLPWRAVAAALCGRSRGSTAYAIVVLLRLPRALSAALVGAALALSGAVLQALLRNPLAEPFTLGVSGGAAFLVTALAAFAPTLFALPFASAGAGFVGALLSGALVFLLAQHHGFSNTALILCGVVLSFFFGSLALVNFVFGRPQALQGALLWLSGDFSLATGTTTLVTCAALIAPVAYVLASSGNLDVLAIGDERALGLGLPVPKLRRTLFIAASLMTGVCVACAGIIGFVGFLIPHLTRLCVGARHKSLLPLSALFGATFLMLADLLARSLLSPIELPVGALTGIVGAAVFLAYYWRGGVRELP